MPRQNKVVKQTIIREEGTQDQDNPVPKLIREYLVDATDYPDSLRDLHYVINVQKYARDGRAVTVTGRVYEDLEKLPDDLGKRFGSSRFKLFIKALDSNNATVGLVKILDYAVEWDGDDDDQDPGDRYDDPPVDQAAADTDREIKLLAMRQAHEKELKQMEMHNQLLLAISQSKNAGGLKPADVLSILETGIAIGQGRPAAPGDADPAGGTDVLGLLNHPLAKVLLETLSRRNGGAAAPPAAPVPDTQAPQPLE